VPSSSRLPFTACLLHRGRLQWLQCNAIIPCTSITELFCQKKTTSFHRLVAQCRNLLLVRVFVRSFVVNRCIGFVNFAEKFVIWRHRVGFIRDVIIIRSSPQAPTFTDHYGDDLPSPSLPSLSSPFAPLLLPTPKSSYSKRSPTAKRVLVRFVGSLYQTQHFVWHILCVIYYLQWSWTTPPRCGCKTGLIMLLQKLSVSNAPGASPHKCLAVGAIAPWSRHLWSSLTATVNFLARTASRCRRAYILPLHFSDWLWTLAEPNTPLQRNMVSTIGKTPTPLHGPKFGDLWFRNGWERLASFCPPPKFLHWETLPALPHGRYIADSRQTLAHVM